MSADSSRLPPNSKLAELFQTIADYLALNERSTCRILAYEKPAVLFRDHPLSVAEMAYRGKLRELPGVGEAIEAKVTGISPHGRSRHPEGATGTLPGRTAGGHIRARAAVQRQAEAARLRAV